MTFSPFIDGRFEALLLKEIEALETLAIRLNLAEDAAVRARGAEMVGGRSGPTSPVEARVGRDGAMWDADVQELRKIRLRALASLRETVYCIEEDLGLRERRRGRRDKYGRLVILTSDS